MVDNISYVQDSAQALVIFHCSHVSTVSLSKGWGFRGVYRPTCFAAMYLVSLGLVWVERVMGTLYISILYFVYRVLCHVMQYACPIVLPLISGL